MESVVDGDLARHGFDILLLFFLFMILFFSRGVTAMIPKQLRIDLFMMKED